MFITIVIYVYVCLYTKCLYLYLYCRWTRLAMCNIEIMYLLTGLEVFQCGRQRFSTYEHMWTFFLRYLCLDRFPSCVITCCRTLPSVLTHLDKQVFVSLLTESYEPSKWDLAFVIQVFLCVWSVWLRNRKQQYDELVIRQIPRGGNQKFHFSWRWKHLLSPPATPYTWDALNTLHLGRSRS